MSASPTVAVLTPEQLAELLERAAERGAARAMERSREGSVLVSFAEAARRLGIALRTVQQRAKDGRLEVVDVAGERMCRLPSDLDPG